MKKPKPTKVWVAVTSSGIVLPSTVRRLRFDAKDAVLSRFSSHAFTIRRATLTLDPDRRTK